VGHPVYNQVDRVQDVFQFGIVLLYCLLGVLPWQKPDNTDSNFNQFSLWRRKKSSKVKKEKKLKLKYFPSTVHKIFAFS